MGKNKAKTAVSVAVEAKPEVEIWRRPQKSTFWPWFPIRSFRQFLAKTYRFATIQTFTDRQMTQCDKGATDSTVGQKLRSFDITPDTVKSKVQKHKMNKAPSVDSVGTKMLLELSEEISDYVAQLFTKSLIYGNAPLDRKACQCNSNV